MYCDTHAHINGEEYRDDLDDIVAQAHADGLAFIVDVGIDTATSHRSIEVASRFPNVYATVGVHPHEAKTVSDGELKDLLDLHDREKVVALGEMGLDYFYDHSPRQRQREVYSLQIEYALARDLPVVIHARDAVQEAIDILARDFKTYPRGVFHCYAGDYRQATQLLDQGMFVSFGGPVTFKKNDALRELIDKLPLDQMLIETDSPYLTPEPFRGKRNAPQHVKLVAERIAQIKGLTQEEIGQVTTANACRLFGIAPPRQEASA